MSLSSLLISSGKKGIDTELDALFKNPPTLIPTPGLSTTPVAKKRKVSKDDVERDSKRSKPSPQKSSDSLTRAEGSSKKPKDKKKAKAKAKPKPIEGSDDDDNPDLEDAYLVGKDSLAKLAENESADDDDDDDGGPTVIVHESLKKIKKSGPKVKTVPSDETPDRRDQRTIFIGNLSLEVAQKRPMLKQLQRHILAQVPTAKIESTRFRSIPFQAPTSKLPDDDNDNGGGGGGGGAAKQNARPHDRERISNWREQERQGGADEDGKNDEKKFLNPNQKKKIAYINQEFHTTADTVNAYLVFAHPPSADARPSNLPPLPPLMDPYDAARVAADKCDGSVFMERVIRVDLVKGHGESGEDGTIDGDPKLSVFVGNLDFASKEEDLRVFFEGVVSAERGPPEGDDDAETGKPKTWVTRVRIVRDKETQMGKGFGYIQFADRECVDELLGLEEAKLKFAKRKLRVQRCKTLPGASKSTRQVTSGKPAQSHARPAPVPIVVPKGDPRLGEKLAHLSKDARKQAKSSDADRVARRLAKKKARIAMGDGGVKMLGKDRERVRKDSAAVKKGAAPRKKESKGRVRSDKSVAKRNMKK